MISSVFHRAGFISRWLLGGAALCVCALPVSPGWAFNDIINGEDATVDDYPMTGGMLAGSVVDFGGTEYEIKMMMCSATLIAPDVVLLAAHCIDFAALEEQYGIDLDAVDIVFSRQSDLTAFDGSPTEWPYDAAFAWEAVMHPGFNLQTLGGGLSENDDIGLLFLEEPILDVPHAFLPTLGEISQIQEGNVVDVVGWGQQTSDQVPPAGSVQLKMKGQSYIAELAAYELQIGLDQEDVRKCHGDSGGPTFMEVSGDWSDPMRLIGVTSHAYDQTDCNETGGVDTRVDYYLDWIDDEMRARCEDGTRSWCDIEGIVTPGANEESGASEVSVEDVKITGCACSQGSPLTGLPWMVPLFGLLAVRREP
jgi:hypothetical protein